MSRHPERFADIALNLEILAEECAEVCRIKSKCIRFGMDDYHPKNGLPNRPALEEEIGHLLFMVEVLEANGIVTEAGLEAAMDAKAEQLPEWYRGWIKPLLGAQAQMSRRGCDWLIFSGKVAKSLEVPAMGQPPAVNTPLGWVREQLRAGKYLSASQWVLIASRHPNWQSFSDAVLDHIEKYTVPQYGDKGSDRASNYTVKECLEHVSRYIDRHGSNSRPDQEQLDLLKMAHYISLADAAPNS